jgi:hypothetical protein
MVAKTIYGKGSLGPSQLNCLAPGVELRNRGDSEVFVPCWRAHVKNTRCSQNEIYIPFSRHKSIKNVT